jgi:hypothetical protein
MYLQSLSQTSRGKGTLGAPQEHDVIPSVNLADSNTRTQDVSKRTVMNTGRDDIYERELVAQAVDEIPCKPGEESGC